MPTIEQVNTMLSAGVPGSLTTAADNFQLAAEALDEAGAGLAQTSDSLRDNWKGKAHNAFQNAAAARRTQLATDSEQTAQYPPPLRDAAAMLKWGKSEITRLLGLMNAEIAAVPPDAVNAAALIAAIHAKYDGLATEVLEKVSSAFETAASALTAGGGAKSASDDEGTEDDAAADENEVSENTAAPDGEGDEEDVKNLNAQGLDGGGSPLGDSPGGTDANSASDSGGGTEAPDAVVGKPPYDPSTDLNWAKTPNSPTSPPSLTPPPLTSPPSHTPSGATPFMPMMPGLTTPPGSGPSTQATGYDASKAYSNSGKGGNGPTVLGKSGGSGMSTTGGHWGGNGLSSNLSPTGAEVVGRTTAVPAGAGGPGSVAGGGMPFMGAGAMGAGAAPDRGERQRKPGLGEEDAWDVVGDATPAMLGKEE
nr:WXG100 family type VII secretion target [Kibdelosporangium sp. MJ126-NF4]CEL16307.1 PE-PGRS FAMILY PROTEIN [Kibdelosporangium sp. MJ126-NF4]CTQ94231.1 PE-PGRS FAMILY PROTEIN [Kibdelosporangium sp. MJ126-NF4]